VGEISRIGADLVSLPAVVCAQTSGIGSHIDSFSATEGTVQIAAKICTKKSATTIAPSTSDKATTLHLIAFNAFKRFEQEARPPAREEL
jgi:hypothetical protein